MRDPLADLFIVPDDAPSPVPADLPGVVRRAARVRARRRRTAILGAVASVVVLAIGSLTLWGGATNWPGRLRGAGPAASSTAGPPTSLLSGLLQPQDLGTGWTPARLTDTGPVTVSGPRCSGRPATSIDTVGRSVTYRQGPAVVEMRVADLTPASADALREAFLNSLDCQAESGTEQRVARTEQADLTLTVGLGAASASGTAVIGRTAVTLTVQDTPTSGVPTKLPQLTDPDWLRSLLRTAVLRATGTTIVLPRATPGDGAATTSPTPSAPVSTGDALTSATPARGDPAPGKGFLQPSDLDGTQTWRSTAEQATIPQSTGGSIALPTCTDGAQIQLALPTARTQVYRPTSDKAVRLEEQVSTLDAANLAAAQDQFAVMHSTLSGCAPYELTFGPYPPDQTMVTLLAEPDLAVLASVDAQQRLFQVTAYGLRGSTFVTLFFPAAATPFPENKAWAIQVAKRALQLATASG